MKGEGQKEPSTVTVSEREVTPDPFVRLRLRPASHGRGLSVSHRRGTERTTPWGPP